MAKFGCPEKFINIVRLFHDGMEARVKDNGEFSEPFPVTNGVKQGCVLAPTLFSMLFSAMLTDAFRDENVGIEFRSRTDGGFYKPQRLRTQSKVMLDILRDLLFADDCALCASTEGHMSSWTKDWGVDFNCVKCGVMHLGKNNPCFTYTLNITQHLNKLLQKKTWVYLLTRS